MSNIWCFFLKKIKSKCVLPLIDIYIFLHLSYDLKHFKCLLYFDVRRPPWNFTICIETEAPKYSILSVVKTSFQFNWMNSVFLIIILNDVFLQGTSSMIESPLYPRGNSQWVRLIIALLFSCFKSSLSLHNLKQNLCNEIMLNQVAVFPSNNSQSNLFNSSETGTWYDSKVL